MIQSLLLPADSLNVDEPINESKLGEKKKALRLYKRGGRKSDEIDDKVKRVIMCNS